MAYTQHPLPHRRNQNESYDSICGQCFATVIASKDETDLAAFEKVHVCDGFSLGVLLYPGPQDWLPQIARVSAGPMSNYSDRVSRRHAFVASTDAPSSLR